LRRAIAAPADSEGGAPKAPPQSSGKLSSQLALVDAVRAEIGVSQTAADALARLAILLEALDSRVRVLADPGSATPGNLRDAGFNAALIDLGRRVEAALVEFAGAVAAGRAPRPFAVDLEDALLVLENERSQLAGSSGSSAALEGRAADLRDLVAVLRSVEETLSSVAGRSNAGHSKSLLHFRLDPFRVKLALRVGIAVVSAFLIVTSLGWSMSNITGPIAFMLAASATRGAAIQSLISLLFVVAVSWLIADVMIVAFMPHLGRAPLALLPAFVVAASFGTIAVKRPQLAALPSIGGLVVFLSVYGGTGAPTDVYGSYDTVCYMLVALGTGWLAGRLLWPATAAGLFRARVAGQIERCGEAVRAAHELDEVERDSHSRELYAEFAEGSVQLGPLHEQARHEPVERALDQPRRALVLALVQNLMDAALSHRVGAAAQLLERGGAALRPLVEVLQREDRAFDDSVKAATEALKGDSPLRASDLAAARAAVEEQLKQLRNAPAPLPHLGADERQRFLAEIDSRRRLVFRQRAIEEWIDEWRKADVTASCLPASAGSR
jgi:hypothetical protein